MTQNLINVFVVAIVTVAKNGYRIHFGYMAKSEALNRMKKIPI